MVVRSSKGGYKKSCCVGSLCLCGLYGPYLRAVQTHLSYSPTLMQVVLHLLVQLVTEILTSCMSWEPGGAPFFLCGLGLLSILARHKKGIVIRHRFVGPPSIFVSAFRMGFKYCCSGSREQICFATSADAHTEPGKPPHRNLNKPL